MFFNPLCIDISLLYPPNISRTWFITSLPSNRPSPDIWWRNLSHQFLFPHVWWQRKFPIITSLCQLLISLPDFTISPFNPVFTVTIFPKALLLSPPCPTYPKPSMDLNDSLSNTFIALSFVLMRLFLDENFTFSYPSGVMLLMTFRNKYCPHHTLVIVG